MPGTALVTVCCIFIASSTSTSCPASTVAPFSTLSETMVPCIGARNGNGALGAGVGIVGRRRLAPAVPPDLP